MERTMTDSCGIAARERGSVLVVALVVLALLTVVGIAATQMSGSELSMAANWKFQRQAFYAAESASGYVARTPDLYGNGNITAGTPRSFSSPEGLLGPKQSFDGTVEYLGASTSPRGSGFEVGKFYSHKYQINSTGFAPRSSKSEVEVGFYRIGFKN